jgi:hypothetical protein
VHFGGDTTSRLSAFGGLGYIGRRLEAWVTGNKIAGFERDGVRLIDHYVQE